MEHIVKILGMRRITHDVKAFVVEKPKDYKFIPGQATLVAINNDKLKTEKRPFTFTSLNDDKNLEFVIKAYNLENNPEHKGITHALHRLKTGDELIIGEPWGEIKYNGPGVFIAGGAGITPFLAIFRELQKIEKLGENKLIFSNKDSRDIILESELINIFRSNLTNLKLLLTREENENYSFNRIDEDFLKNNVKNFNQNFYICGPKKMVEEINNILIKLGVKKELIIF